MKTFFALAFLITLGLSADVWLNFVNEEGEAYQGTARIGMTAEEADMEAEELSTWRDHQRGGRGGGAWADDCQTRKGLFHMQLKCGHFLGAVRLQCKNGAWNHWRGAGLGHGRAGVTTINASGVTKVLIGAGAYVDRLTMYRGNTRIISCGRSGGGHKYWVHAPAGMTLCALKGRAGWWMDALQTGWCSSGPKPCPNGCVSKTPPKPTGFVQNPQKHDFNSRSHGDQLRRWFQGGKLVGVPKNIEGSVWYRDQAWGNKKTDVFFCCNCGGHIQNGGNCVSLCGTNVRGWKLCRFNKAVPRTCRKGSSTCVAYRVGGGGGHRFYGKHFNGKVTYKSALLNALDITYEGLYVSELFVDYAEEQETNYVSHVAVGFGGLMAGLAGAFYLRRKQSAQYQALV